MKNIFTLSMVLGLTCFVLPLNAQNDTIPPVITLMNGSFDTVDLNCNGALYLDPGATAYDSAEGDITSVIITWTNVTLQKPGKYYTKYYAEDRSGNFTIATRTIIVSPPKPHGFAKQHISGDLYLYYTNRNFESTRKQYAWYINGVKLSQNKSSDSLYIFHDASSHTFVSMEEWFCDGDTSMFYNLIDTDSTSKSISGYVGLDLNNNCIKDSSDKAATIPIILYNEVMQPIRVYMSENGEFKFEHLDSGKYFVSPDNKFKGLDFCQKQAKEVITSKNENDGIDWMVQCNANSDPDPKVSFITAQNMRPGLTALIQSNVSIYEFLLKYQCLTSAISATIDIEIDGKLTYLKPDNNSLTPSVVDGLHFTYTINNINNIRPTSFNLLFDVDTTATITDTVNVKVRISNLSKDADTTNNTLMVQIPVRNSYDPNMVEIQPFDVLENYEQAITHTIHFQNTGNDVAFNIRVRDTLNALLDPESFELLYSSHPLSYDIRGHALHFYFKDINLADSFSDEKASHGQIIFKVKPKAPLKTSDLVDNKAFIYFDYNPPVITNTALLNVRKVLDPGSAIKPINPYIPLKLYPNPTKDLLTILYTSNNVKCKIDVYDVMGHLIGQYELVNGRFELDTRTLSAGMYLLVISSGDERVVARFGVEK